MDADFLNYALPAELIAQVPCAERDQSRLLVVRRAAGTIGHRTFLDLPELLAPGDLLVLNDTRVLPARLLGHRASTGAKWEGLFLHEHPGGVWELLCQTRGKLREGEEVQVGAASFRLQLVGRTPEGHWLALPSEPGPVVERLGRYGQVPLPPYIRKGQAAAADRERYQTVYARQTGAVAAPTAGLHFTPRVFDRLRQRGIGWTFVTLHVGPGTFQPIQVEDFLQHKMHREWGQLPDAAAEMIAARRAAGGRIVAV